MGSVTPLIATIEKIKEIDSTVTPLWVGTRHGVERAFVERLGIQYHAIASAKLRRYFDLRSFLIPFVAAAGVAQSIWLVMTSHPKMVVGCGAFTQVPLIMVARLLGVPVVIHQEDVEVGLANQISSFDTKLITATFDASVPQFRGKHVEVIGNPVRRVIAELNDPVKRAQLRKSAYKRWGFDETKPTLLVLGGGTGALGLNERIVANLDELVAGANVLLLAGQGKLVEAKPRKNYVAVEFLNEEMAEAYAVADLAVSRAGLGTLTELGVSGIPTVLVPLPGHQEKNAAFISERHAAVVVLNNSTDRIFVDTVLRLLNDRDRRLELGRAIAEVFPVDAAEKLAKFILANIKR